jgi:hypothetical protein
MPYMMVQSSATATKKMAQNNLSPAEFMRPFGYVGDLGGFVLRTVDKNEPVRLSNFRVNFIDAACLNPDPKPTKI